MAPPSQLFPRDWVAALLAAGVTPAAFVPDASRGRFDEEPAGHLAADVLEDTELRVHPVDRTAAAPPVVSFLDGIQQWRVVGYDGVAPIVRGYVAAAVRRRGPDRRLRTVAQDAREFAVAPLATLGAERRAVLEAHADVIDLPDLPPSQPGPVLEEARRVVDGARQAVERSLAERALRGLGEREWLVVDGLLSVSGKLASHPRAIGVIKSHGAQFFEGEALRSALTVPAAHRTSVFRARGGHARNDVYSWYLRLWPWEGSDLLFGLVRVEARAGSETIAAAGVTSGWLWRERAPVSTPDARWDRLLYPIHDVETYLRSRAPRDLSIAGGSRLPRTGT